ncbi:MAG TPA: SGNH/GDSL hydrolase family protein [Acidimicrobiia bacterium]
MGGTFRRAALGLPLVATTGLAAMGAQAWYAGHRRLPRYRDLEIGGRFGPAEAPELRIAVLGDSTVSGTGLDDPGDLWLRRALEPMTERYHLRVKSEAVSGARARDVLMYQVRAAVAWSPDVAVVSVGANDALRRFRIAGFEHDLRAIVDALRDCGSVVVLAGVGDVGAAPLLPFPLRMVVSERARAADRVHARIAAQSAAVSKIPVAEETTAIFRSRPDLFCGDLFHPNRHGHRVWAATARPVLERAVVERSQDATLPLRLRTVG